MTDSKPLYSKVSIALACPSCSEKVFLQGPCQNECPSCGKSLKIDSGFWTRTLDNPFGGRKDNLMMMGKHRSVIIETGRGAPKCEKCGAKLKTDEITSDTTVEFACDKCNAIYYAYPPPESMKSIVAVQKGKPVTGAIERIFCEVAVPLPDSAAKDKRKSERKASREGKPPGATSILCEQCGASLNVPESLPPVLKCSYCGGSQRLPEELLQSRGSAQKKRTWYIRWAALDH